MPRSMQRFRPLDAAEPTMFHHFGRIGHARAVNAQAVALEEAFAYPWARAGCGEFRWAEWRCVGEIAAAVGRKSPLPLHLSPRGGTSRSTIVRRPRRLGVRWATVCQQMFSIGFRGTLPWLGLRPRSERVLLRLPENTGPAWRVPVPPADIGSLRRFGHGPKNRRRVGIAGSRSS
jgi:hypothetical protein